MTIIIFIILLFLFAQNIFQITVLNIILELGRGVVVGSYVGSLECLHLEL